MMDKVPEFKIDKWTQNEAAKARIVLHGSCAGAISLSELVKLADPTDPTNNTSPSSRGPIDPDVVLTYGELRGSLRLRQRIADLHSDPERGVTVTADDVLITPGSIMANYLALTNIVSGPDDHVICQYPTFPQLWAVPQFVQGAEVSLWKLKKKKSSGGGGGGSEHDASWESSLDELRGMIRKNTKAIIINNPNNPTGAILPESTLHDLIALVENHNSTLLPDGDRPLTIYSDEVFAPLFFPSSSPTSPHPNPNPPPLVSLGYRHTVSIGSTSKTIGLAGIRVGWIVSQDKGLMSRIATARDYTTTSVSQLDDAVAAYALSEQIYPKLLERNRVLCEKGIELVRRFVEGNNNAKAERGKRNVRVEWIPPLGCGVAFVRFLWRESGEAVDDRELARRFVKETGVSLIPAGFCFGHSEDGKLDDGGAGQYDGLDPELKGYVRIALGEPEEALAEGLELLDKFLERF